LERDSEELDDDNVRSDNIPMKKTRTLFVSQVGDLSMLDLRTGMLVSLHSNVAAFPSFFFHFSASTNIDFILHLHTLLNADRTLSTLQSLFAMPSHREFIGL
jgi:hypothetical protein